VEAGGKFLGHFADAQEFRAGDVDYERRCGGERERLQAHGVGVTLPDGIEIAHGKRDWLAREDALCDIDEDAVAKFGGVIETNEGNGNRESAAEMFEDALAAEAAHCVFTDGIERIGFAGACLRDGRKAVDVAGGKCGDAAFGESFADETGKKTVHRPGEGFLAGGAEFHSSHVDDIGHVGKSGESTAVKQVAADGFDVPGVELLFELRRGKTRDADDAAGHSGGIRSATGHAGESGAHFSADAENENIALECGEGANRRLIRLAKKEVEGGEIADGVFIL